MKRISVNTAANAEKIPTVGRYYSSDSTYDILY